jgi:hypothetical protein
MRRQGWTEWFARKPVTTDGLEIKPPERTPTEHMEFAFHSRTAKHIKERDNWTCLCGKGRKDGLRVQASHKDHDRRNPYYNHPDNGTTLCVECHIREHIALLKEADYDTFDWAWHSVRLLANSVWKESFHDVRYLYNHPETLEDDRVKLMEVFDDNGVDLFEFVKVDE